jgi:hypothetical protein
LSIKSNAYQSANTLLLRFIELISTFVCILSRDLLTSVLACPAILLLCRSAAQELL